MGSVVSLSNVFEMVPPVLHFPVRRPFQIDDQYNGKKRGTWWFRSKATGEVIGPYHHEAAARMAQQIEDNANGFK